MSCLEERWNTNVVVVVKLFFALKGGRDSPCVKISHGISRPKQVYREAHTAVRTSFQILVKLAPVLPPGTAILGCIRLLPLTAQIGTLGKNLALPAPRGKRHLPVPLSAHSAKAGFS